MEELIRFIVHNLFFVVVIAGFVISFLSKARKGGSGTGRMPDFGGSPVFPKTQRMPASPARPARSGGPAADTPQTDAARASTVYRTREATAAPASRGESRPAGAELNAASPYEVPSGSTREDEKRHTALQGQAPKGSRGELSGGRAGGPFRMPEGGELQRAFVLSEVLGPPRAKRPFRKP